MKLLGSTPMLSHTRAVFVIAFKRLLAQRGLALATLIGLVTVIGLTMSIPVYADAIYNRVLLTELVKRDAGVMRPPFAFMFTYIGALNGSQPWDKVQPVDTFLSSEASPFLGLPQKVFVRHFQTDKFGLYPPGTTTYRGADSPLEWVSLAYSQGIEKHITLVEGRLPADADAASDSPVEALMSEPLANKIGAQTGETYHAYASLQTRSRGTQVYQIPVHIVGIWKPNDPEDEYWFYSPSSLDTALNVTENSLTGRLNSQIDDAIYGAVWYWVADSTKVRSRDALPLLSRINTTEQRAQVLLPTTQLWISPIDELQSYQQITGFLTLFLFILSIPIVGLFVAFIGLVVELSVERQRNEIAMLRSRGGTVFQVAGIAALEALLLGLAALVLSVPTSSAVAFIVGKTRSFLDFSAPNEVQGILTQTALQLGLAAIGFTIIVQVIPTLSASQHTIVTYKQERARTLRPPWWQRAWLDVLLIIPAAYGAYLLRRQGSIVLPSVGGVVPSVSISHDPFQNPLLFLVPSLGILALTLVVVRILPIVMRALAWLAARTPSVGFLMAVRHLARTPGLYAAPMILLVLTLSLSTFTASLARTLDRHLSDQIRYQVGADMSIRDSGESVGVPGLQPSSKSQTSLQEEQQIQTQFRPVTDYLALPGAQAVMRVGRFDIQHESTKQAVLIGVDRVDFPRIAYWRRDFAPASLGALMNDLAAVPKGVLVSNDYLRQQGLGVGDVMPVTLETPTLGPTSPSTKLTLKVVGGIDLFPTWYPQDGPLFVANLDYILDHLPAMLPYEVWLKLAPNADSKRITQQINELGRSITRAAIAPQQITADQQRPERQGMFGVLSVGFVAAALLTVLGFMLYALFSFRSRFIELGVLRAIGLSVEQMASFLAWELAFLLLVGLLVGTGLGVWMSQLFIPYLQIGETATAYVPPYIVEIAWPELVRIYLLFGLLFVAALGALSALLMRIKIFQAVKLGETT